MNTGLKMTILGYLATMFTIGVNEMWHFWFVEEIFAVPNHWMFNMGVVVAFMGALAYVRSFTDCFDPSRCGFDFGRAAWRRLQTLDSAPVMVPRDDRGWSVERHSYCNWSSGQLE
jgi:hypothetical protein